MSKNRHRQNVPDIVENDGITLPAEANNITGELTKDSVEKVEAPNPWQPPPEPADEQEEVTITPAALPVRLEKELAGYMRRAIFTCGYGVEPGCRQRVEMWADPKGKQIIVEPMPLPTSPWRVHNCPAGRK